MSNFNDQLANDEQLAALLQDSSWREQLTQYSGGAPASLISLCEIFLMEVPGLLDSVDRTIQSGQTQGLYTAVHTLKSCLTYVAPGPDVEVAAQVELLAQKVEASDVKLEEFANRFQRLALLARRWVVCVKTLLAETKAVVEKGQ